LGHRCEWANAFCFWALNPYRGRLLPAPPYFSSWTSIISKLSKYPNGPEFEIEGPGPLH